LHAQSATKTEDFLRSEQKRHALFCVTGELTYAYCGACRDYPSASEDAYFWFSVVAGSIGAAGACYQRFRTLMPLPLNSPMEVMISPAFSSPTRLVIMLPGLSTPRSTMRIMSG